MDLSYYDGFCIYHNYITPYLASAVPTFFFCFTLEINLCAVKNLVKFCLNLYLTFPLLLWTDNTHLYASCSHYINTYILSGSICVDAFILFHLFDSSMHSFIEALLL